MLIIKKYVPYMFVFLLFAIFFRSAYAGDKMFPEDAFQYIKIRELCSKARYTIFIDTTSKQQYLAKSNARKYCTNIEAEYQNLVDKYQNNTDILDQLILANELDNFFFWTPNKIQFGKTVDVLMPSDVVRFTSLTWLCFHFAGEFGGDLSERDREVVHRMDELKCNQLDRKRAVLERKYKDSQDVQLLLKQLADVM